MTIYVNELEPLVNIALNQANLPSGFGTGLYFFDIISEYSHQTVASLRADVTTANDRYSMIQVEFPIDFGNSHQNGVSYYTLRNTVVGDIEKGLVKIITNPGGEINRLAYDSGPITEDRVSDVYFRPNY